MKRSEEQMRREAQRISAEILEQIGSLPEGAGAQQGSAHRKLPEDLRKRFILLRSEMMERGIYDPVLVRFDSATAPQAETRRIAEQLAQWGNG